MSVVNLHGRTSLPQHVAAEVQRILDAEARRQLAQASQQRSAA